MFSIILGSFLLVLGTILPIVNPPGVAPIFWSLTTGASNKTRKILAKRVALNAIFIVIVATFLGKLVLFALGISIPAVRVAGGLLVIGAAWKLLNAEDPDTGMHDISAETYTLDKAKSSAFYPLTFPITCGPGTVAASITLGTTFSYSNLNLELLSNIIGTVLGAMGVGLAIFISLYFAAELLHKLGNQGTVIFMRLSAFILLCIGVQIFWTGMHEFILILNNDIK
ncbi:MarC family protein [Taylorella equigenitalis]|uniref:UPF0056 inner membrane protein n=3 Tax=Taylorella equigenitalis TaxID=29575 RepID=A0A654KIM9_TAYEM|nr:MarC family protein [Taylorella equigenitalis]ADU92311.1 putative multiple antibiotic resistance protein [Taylorella equigenitalis MCE9]AFN35865.1 putative multiple antibiotic resistance protein [Taylorella equigenitalis ATCC 35865]ASY30504.1 antibiotic resistance protein [Taylorella equigenitalis]ASY37811.1 antibiotic resistance protein [Taylorella equigenitalis]ASY39279.1 antibiotic resistance protein [Taylorella equigenitalis]